MSGRHTDVALLKYLRSILEKDESGDILSSETKVKERIVHSLLPAPFQGAVKREKELKRRKIEEFAEKDEDEESESESSMKSLLSGLIPPRPRLSSLSQAYLSFHISSTLESIKKSHFFTPLSPILTSEQLRQLKMEKGQSSKDKDSSISDTTSEFILPDGTSVEMAPSACVLEGMFNGKYRSLLSPDNPIHSHTIQSMIAHSTHTLPDTLQQQLVGNIFPSGGVCNCRGFSERLAREIPSKFPSVFSPRILSLSAHDLRTVNVLGGCVIGAVSAFQSEWISSVEWSEMGEKALEKKWNG
eukprot:gnl/Carplike_NY0171/6816_a9380_232.p1 GENE.gnl/Carplike_NY0171/6816_a9380_232~~gnl/Carplike_NY0171/6816_a9380_232.p1  ORF type:complete len:352 (-),score=84.66 gnl/Carplike_NY0171/6816_a9380_232:159-1058(-)